MAQVRVSGGFLDVDTVEGPGGIWGPTDPRPTPPIHLPEPPPGIWPPPVSIWPPTPLPPDYPLPPGSIWPPVRPERPSQGLPHPPGHPDQGLPPQPGHPDQGLPVPGQPDQGLPQPPGTPSHPITSGRFLVAIVGLSQGGGLKVVGYTVVDPSLKPSHPIEPTPEPKII